MARSFKRYRAFTLLEVILAISLTGVVLMFNNPAKDGALLRLSFDYEVFDGFLVGGGVLMFLGLSDPVDTWNDNDRIFLRAKYSF